MVLESLTFISLSTFYIPPILNGYQVLPPKKVSRTFKKKNIHQIGSQLFRWVNLSPSSSRHTVDERNPAPPGTWDVEDPVKNEINYLSTGARFLPPTVSNPTSTASENMPRCMLAKAFPVCRRTEPEPESSTAKKLGSNKKKVCKKTKKTRLMRSESIDFKSVDA